MPKNALQVFWLCQISTAFEWRVVQVLVADKSGYVMVQLLWHLNIINGRKNHFKLIKNENDFSKK